MPCARFWNQVPLFDSRLSTKCGPKLRVRSTRRVVRAPAGLWAPAGEGVLLGAAVSPAAGGRASR